MGDLISILLFIGIAAATWGLVALCDRHVGAKQ